jgi:hypothetical protein
MFGAPEPPGGNSAGQQNLQDAGPEELFRNRAERSRGVSAAGLHRD